MRRKKEEGDPYMQRFYVQDTLCVCYLIIYDVRRNSNYENIEEPRCILSGHHLTTIRQ
jgi:hypothetical protein